MCTWCCKRTSIAIFEARNLRLWSSRDLWLWFLIAIFFGRGLFGRCIFRNFFCDAVFFGLSFGRCGVLNCLLTLRRGSFGHRLLRTLFLSSDAVCLDAISFELSFAFGRCLFRTFFQIMQGSDAVAFLWTRIFRAPFILDADALLRKLLFFLGHGCFCFSERGCSSLDADAFLRRGCSSSDPDSYGGLLKTFIRVPWYTYLDI